MGRFSLAVLALATAGFLGACTDPVEPQPAETLEAQFAASPNACWGQASKVFAKMGLMGEHSANQPNPRIGLRNLARVLYEDGVISEPTMEALGQFVVNDLGLTVDACM